MPLHLPEIMFASNHADSSIVDALIRRTVASRHDTPKSSYVRSHELALANRKQAADRRCAGKARPDDLQLDRLLANCRRLIQGAKILGVPVFATEQYPKGLGTPLPQLAELLDRPDKLRFSCAEVLDWGLAAEQTDNRFQIVVAGMEAHVCVLQTVLDLLASGFQVFVPGRRRLQPQRIRLEDRPRPHVVPAARRSSRPNRCCSNGAKCRERPSSSRSAS